MRKIHHEHDLTPDEQRVAIARYDADLPMTLEDAAWVLGMAPKTLANYAGEGKIGYVKTMDRGGVMFMREHLVEYLTDRRVERRAAV